MQNERRVWTMDQDQELKQLALSFGVKKWKEVALSMSEKFKYFNRSGKQCRQRWYNYLSPSIFRDNISPEEYLQFINLWISFGKKWTKIAKEMGGRTQNSAKNFYYSNIGRAVKMTKVRTREPILKRLSLNYLQKLRVELKHQDQKSMLSEFVLSLLQSSDCEREYSQRKLEEAGVLLARLRSFRPDEPKQVMDQTLATKDSIRQAPTSYPCDQKPLQMTSESQFRRVESQDLTNIFSPPTPKDSSNLSALCSSSSSYLKFISLSDSEIVRRICGQSSAILE